MRNRIRPSPPPTTTDKFNNIGILINKGVYKKIICFIRALNVAFITGQNKKAADAGLYDFLFLFFYFLEGGGLLYHHTRNRKNHQMMYLNEK